MKNKRSGKILLTAAAGTLAAAMLASCAAVTQTEDTSSYNEADAAEIILQGDSISCDASSLTVDGNIVTISSAGSYIISGSIDDGQIKIDAGDDDDVVLMLSGCDITSSDSAAVYVVNAGKVTIITGEGTVNTLSNGGTFAAEGDTDIDAVIFSRDDLILSGSGTLTIESPAGHGIISKDDLTVNGGTIDITSSRDGLKANETLTVEDGVITISAEEAVESTQVIINGGTLTLSASDDGINASQKSDSLTPLIEINGGSITIVMGQGDTDAIDSNGDLAITGGTIDITAQFAFDYDGNCEFTGGTVTVNGEQVDTITNQFEDGMMPGGNMPQMPGDGSMPEMPGDGQFPGEPPQMPEDGSMPQMPGDGQFPGDPPGQPADG